MFDNFLGGLLNNMGFPTRIISLAGCYSKCFNKYTSQHNSIENSNKQERHNPSYHVVF
jgi:hypothetical protein